MHLRGLTYALQWYKRLILPQIVRIDAPRPLGGRGFSAFFPTALEPELCVRSFTKGSANPVFNNPVVLAGTPKADGEDHHGRHR